MAKTSSRGTRGQPSANAPTATLAVPSKRMGHAVNQVRVTQSADAMAHAPPTKA